MLLTERKSTQFGKFPIRSNRNSAEPRIRHLDVNANAWLFNVLYRGTFSLLLNG